MSGIVLKDGSGNAVEYSGVTQIKVGDESFSHMKDLHCYACIPLGDAVRITKKITSLSSNDIWFFGLSENDLQEIGYQNSSGGYAVQICITRNGNLVVGNSYTDLDGGV